MRVASWVRPFATPRTVACQAPLSIEFSMQEYCNGLPFPSPRDLPDPGIEPGSPALQAVSLLIVCQDDLHSDVTELLKLPYYYGIASNFPL